MLQVIEFVIKIFMFLVIFRYFSIMLGNPRCHIFIVSISLVFFSASLLYINQLQIPYINTISVFILVFAASYLFPGTSLTRVTYTIIYVVLSLAVETLLTGILDLFVYGNTITNFRGQEYYILALGLNELLCFFFIEIICKIKKSKDTKIPNKIMVSILSVWLISIMIALGITYALCNYEQFFNALSVIIITGLLYINYLVFYLFDKFNIEMKNKHEKQLLELEIQSKDSYYKQIEEHQNEIRLIKHDLKNQLITLRDQLDNTSNTQTFIDELLPQLAASSSHTYCGNTAIDSILNFKKEEASAKNIKMKYNIKLPLDIEMESTDIGIIFGNLLDNAIEGVEKLPDNEDKEIILTAMYRNNIITLEFVNKYHTIKKKSHSGFFTSKKDSINHGLGLKSVKDRVEKYDGMLDISTDHNLFVVKILLIVP